MYFILPQTWCSLFTCVNNTNSCGPLFESLPWSFCILTVYFSLLPPARCEVGIALQRADVSVPPSRDPRWLQDVPKAVVQPACHVLVTSRAGADFLCLMLHLPFGGLDLCRRKSPATVSCSTEAPQEGLAGSMGEVGTCSCSNHGLTWVFLGE